MEENNKKLRVAVVGCGSTGARSGKHQAALLRAIELAKEHGHEVIHVVEGGELRGMSVDLVIVDDCKEMPPEFGRSRLVDIIEPIKNLERAKAANEQFKNRSKIKILHNPKENGIDRWTKRYSKKSKW